MLFLCIVGSVIAIAFVAMFVWTHRSERDIEIAARVLTEGEQHARMVDGTVATTIFMGQRLG